jgi:large repetitive protein
MKKFLPVLFSVFTIPALTYSQCGPLITCPSAISVNATSGQCGANVTFTATAVNQCPTGTTTIWSENFQSGGTGWTLNASTGTNVAQPNVWEVNQSEGGVTPPGCGVANNGDLTLHITCSSMFCGSFLTGAIYNAANTSNTRAESPAISTTGYSGLTLNFNFISLGDGLNDNASVWYNAGAGWVVLTNSIKSTVCGSGQGKWSAYTATLPAACDNVASLKIGFNWTNNADNVGSDPSVAINDITITAPGGNPPSISYSAASGSFFPVGTTTVTATATDDLNQTANCTFSVTVTDNQAPVFSSCPSSTTVTANNSNCSATVNWTAPVATDNCSSLTVSSSHASGTSFPLGTTSVSYTANDGNGNTATCSFDVTVVGDIDVSMSASGASCNGDSSGSAFAFVSAGTPNFSYSWAPYGGTGAASTPLSAGSYTCTITDGIGCTTTLSAVITEPAAITGTQNDTICAGQSLTVGGSTYTMPGTYVDILTAANGCDSTHTTNLAVRPAPAVTINETLSAVVCENSVDTLTATGALSYSWSTGETTDSIFVTHMAGFTQWIVTGTASNGCTNSDTISISSVSLLTPVTLSMGSIDTLCAQDGAALLGTAGSPGGGTWSGPGISGFTFDPTAAGVGTHMITYSITNGDGCVSADSAAIYVDACLSVLSSEKSKELVVVLPNPNNGTFSIEAARSGRIEIINCLGETVHAQTIVKGKNNVSYVNCSGGIYFVKFSSGNSVKTIKIVKQD